MKDTSASVTFQQLSSEHHAGHELWITNASSVSVHCMQTEDRSPDAAPTASVVAELGSVADVTGLFSYYAANVSSRELIAYVRLPGGPPVTRRSPGPSLVTGHRWTEAVGPGRVTARHHVLVSPHPFLQAPLCSSMPRASSTCPCFVNTTRTTPCSTTVLCWQKARRAGARHASRRRTLQASPRAQQHPASSVDAA